jgi:hypothetical protein
LIKKKLKNEKKGDENGKTGKIIRERIEREDGREKREKI